MKLKSLLLAVPASLAVIACTQAHAGSYTVTLPLSADMNGVKAYLTDYDTGAKLDSTIVDKGVARFAGDVDEPLFARIIVDGERGSQLVLEPGDIKAEYKAFASGSPLNDRMQQSLAYMDTLQARYSRIPQTTEAEVAAARKIVDEFNGLFDRYITENSDNPLGYFFFLQQAYEWDLATLRKQMEQYPQWAKTQKVRGLEENLVVEEQTSPGHPYKDFAITYNGTTRKLSDYVGKDGQYTLVDFWASWCGPCRREMPGLKELYEKYNGKGMNFVGVAVWDEPEATLNAIRQLQLPWDVILNAQTVPTDLYGISGIPCVIIIDPQGKIVSRGKQGADLRLDVESLMSSWVPAASVE